jgi:hypothetical protein
VCDTAVSLSRGILKQVQDDMTYCTILFQTMSLRGGTTKQSHRIQYTSEEIATLRSQ